MTARTRSPQRSPDAPRPVVRSDDASERAADQAARAVVRGERVPDWSIAAQPASVARQPVQRQGSGKTSDEKEYKEAAQKTFEAIRKTKPVKALEKRVMEHPTVRKVKDAATSPAGIATLVAAGAGGVAYLAATGKELPIQPPEFPLDVVTKGLSGKVTYTGPVNRPTFVGLTLTYKQQAPKGKTGPSEKDRFRAETARLAAEQERFRAGLSYAPGSKEAEEQRMVDEAIVRYIIGQSGPPGVPGLVLPLTQQPPEATRQDEPVRRSPATKTGSEPGSAHVGDALSSPGRPLDDRTRRTMEARFGHDFSQVRIHDDSRAASSAAGLAAVAYTVGRDIVFGKRAPTTSSAEGTHLLAHELAHVVQQTGPAQGPVQRRGVFETIGIWLGLEEGTWEEEELRDYLEAVTSSGEIDGSYDADNKARAIVRRWKAGTAGWDLLPNQKIMLIKEMLDGPTLGEDETAIIDLLELSDASDLRAILGGSDGVGYAEIEPHIDGDNRERLRTWAASRFAGGRDALLTGRVDVVGETRPRGAPEFGFDADILDARFDSDRTVEDLIDIIDTFSDRDRGKALHHLSQVRRPRQARRLRYLAERAERETDPAKLETLKTLGKRWRNEMLKTERVLLHYFEEAVPTSEADLIAGTTATPAARAAEIREALRPPRRTTSSGAPATFRKKIPGEADDYEKKVRDTLDLVVAKLYDRLAKDKGKAEHRDPAKTRELEDFEEIGNVSRAETLKVFGGFLTSPAPALKADTRRRRGNIHDRFTDFERELRRMSPAQRRESARQLVLYLFQSSSRIRRINHHHDASPEFDTRNRPTNEEARILVAISREYVRPRATVIRLNEIDRGWTGVQSAGDIWVQRWRGETPEEDRLLLWKVFQTLIHEYLHALVHGEYSDYADTFGDTSREWNTLMEGVDSLLTEIVWENVIPRVKEKALREKVEGPTYAAEPPIDVAHAGITGRYPSYTEALKLVDLVGIQNVYAAYFLGKVDRIGGGGTP